MTANQYISIALLLGRGVVLYFMIKVIRKQHRVLKAKNYPELNELRQRNLVFSVIILLGNVVPILIDTLGIFGKGSFGLLLAYVFSNNITAMLSAYMLWSNLVLAEKIKIIDIDQAIDDIKQAVAEERAS